MTLNLLFIRSYHGPGSLLRAVGNTEISKTFISTHKDENTAWCTMQLVERLLCAEERALHILKGGNG